MDWTAILVASVPVVGAIATTIITSRQIRKDIKAIELAQLDLMRNEITKVYYKRQNHQQLLHKLHKFVFSF